MMEENKKSNNKLITIILGVLLAAVLGYTFYSNSEHKKITDAIEDEKLEIEQNLDSMIVRYEDAIAQKTAMSGELSLERDKIIALRDSIKGLKTINYSLISKYRKQLAQLEVTNKELLSMNESLTSDNKLLTINLDSANVKIVQQLAKNDTLSNLNLKLTEKVTIGSALKVSSAKVLAMRERTSGKLVETTRSRNTDAFRVNFTIASNAISEQGEREIYVQILDSKGNTLAVKGEFLMEGNPTNYSDKTIVDYKNDAVDVISLVEVNRDFLTTGLYTVNLFIENKFVGSSTITLK